MEVLIRFFCVSSLFVVLTIDKHIALANVLKVDKCKLEDSACLTAGFQKGLEIFVQGIPELGIENLDPVEMEDTVIEMAGLKFALTKGQFKGLKSAVFNNVKWDVKKKIFNVEFYISTGIIMGHYIASGQLLSLPLSGEGEATTTIKDLIVKSYVDYDIVKGADGKDHISLLKYGFTTDIKDGVTFKLSNLFNGNKVLSDNMHALINENWKALIATFGPQLLRCVGDVIFKNMGKYFEKEPLGDIAQV